MLRILQNRNLFRFTVIVLVALAITAPSLLVPIYLGRGAEAPVAITLDVLEDSAALDALHDGYRYELAGNLEDALTKYRTAANAETDSIREVAIRGADRVYSKLTELQTIYSDLRTLQDMSLRVRALFLAALLLALIISLLGRVWPRRGIVLRPFTVAPQLESETVNGFNLSLTQEINRIVRAYSSDQFSRMGVKIAMPDIVTDNEQGDIWARALSSLREGELKAIGSFSAGEVLRFFRNIGDRPEYMLSGNVVVMPQEASAQAQLTRMKDRKVIATWEASSLEAESITVTGLNSPARRIIPSNKRAKTSQIVVHTAVSQDERETAKFLAELAVVLACKIWLKLAQGASAEMRPTSWQTVFHFVQVLNTLE